MNFLMSVRSYFSSVVVLMLTLLAPMGAQSHQCQALHVGRFSSPFGTFPAETKYFVTSGGRELIYKFQPSSKGKDALTVVNIHGLAEDLNFMDRYSQLWSVQDVNVVSIALPGTDLREIKESLAHTGKLPEFNPENYVYDVAEFLRDQGFTKVALTGHSMGGGIVLAIAALLNSRKIKVSVAFVNGFLNGRSTLDPLAMLSRNVDPERIKKRFNGTDLGAFIRLGIERYLQSRRVEGTLRVSDEDFKLLVDSNFQLIKAAKEMPPEEVTAQLEKVFFYLRGVHVLLIGGAYDPLIKPETLEHLRDELNGEGIPTSLEIVDSPSADHHLIMNDPWAVFKRTEPFFEQSFPHRSWFRHFTLFLRKPQSDQSADKILQPASP